ncbi:MAG: hypothetical protein RSD14_04895 [Clostridia bacterium]
MENREFIEAQKEHLNVIGTVHTRLYNMLQKFTNKQDIKREMVSLLEYAYDDMLIVQKDIKISEHDTENNNSL